MKSIASAILRSSSYSAFTRLMAVTAGVTVANNYYNQPLLPLMVKDLGVSADRISLVATLTQLGYALGLFFLLPTGDMFNRRHVVLTLMGLSTMMVLTFAVAPGYPINAMIGLVLGFVSIVPQILPPIASQISPPAIQARAVSQVMGGLLLGIVLSRFFGGVIGDLFGWRAVYMVAATVMLVLGGLLYCALPQMPATFSGSYGALMASLVALWRQHARLRWISLAAALQFGAFGAFWVTVSFHLADLPQAYGSGVAGALALVGAGGVLGALLVGRCFDRAPTGLVLTAAGLLMLAAFLVLAFGGTGLAGLVIGVVLLDLGMQISHVLSMTKVLELSPSAKSRLNTIYMTTRFIGGAIGTWAGSLAWSHGGWEAVCLTAGGACLLALVITYRLAGSIKANPCQEPLGRD